MLSYILQGDHDHPNVDVLFRGAHYFLDRESAKTEENRNLRAERWFKNRMIFNTHTWMSESSRFDLFQLLKITCGTDDTHPCLLDHLFWAAFAVEEEEGQLSPQ